MNTVKYTYNYSCTHTHTKPVLLHMFTIILNLYFHIKHAINVVLFSQNNPNSMSMNQLYVQLSAQSDITS